MLRRCSVVNRYDGDAGSGSVVARQRGPLIKDKRGKRPVFQIDQRQMHEGPS